MKATDFNTSLFRLLQPSSGITRSALSVLLHTLNYEFISTKPKLVIVRTVDTQTRMVWVVLFSVDVKNTKVGRFESCFWLNKMYLSLFKKRSLSVATLLVMLSYPQINNLKAEFILTKLELLTVGSMEKTSQDVFVEF